MALNGENPLTWLRGSLGGWTQARLADELGISEAVVSRIEAGKAGIGNKTLEALWRRFGRRFQGRGVSQLDLLAWNRERLESEGAKPLDAA